ncbi:MAG: sigma-70 family RNA polymerase sigma factor, partial [bacterium]|nr:sigma-70 family RNA polymerase sigma factor [bacterium]
MGFTGTAARLCPERQPDTSVPASTIRNSAAAAVTTASVTNQEREQLILLHLPQVRLVAETMRSRLGFAAELSDLIGYGVVGLLRAVDRFEPSRGFLLKTYAEHRIRGAILDGLRGMDWLSRTARKKERKYQESLQEAERIRSLPPSAEWERSCSAQEGSEEPAPEENCSAPHIPFLELINAGGNLEDLERLSERSGWRQGLASGDGNPETLYQHKEMQEKLMQAMTCLSFRHRQVIYLYYQQQLNMKEIAAILNVHESRVSQIHSA